jgi:hypothetical protein
MIKRPSRPTIAVYEMNLPRVGRRQQTQKPNFNDLEMIGAKNLIPD